MRRGSAATGRHERSGSRAEDEAIAKELANQTADGPEARGDGAARGRPGASLSERFEVVTHVRHVPPVARRLVTCGAQEQWKGSTPHCESHRRFEESGAIRAKRRRSAG